MKYIYELNLLKKGFIYMFTYYKASLLTVTCVTFSKWGCDMSTQEMEANHFKSDSHTAT